MTDMEETEAAKVSEGTPIVDHASQLSQSDEHGTKPSLCNTQEGSVENELETSHEVDLGIKQALADPKFRPKGGTTLAWVCQPFFFMHCMHSFRASQPR